MNNNIKKVAKLLIFFGLISLFGDMIYESARSINGPFLNLLGANAAIVGLIVGVGEFVGYALRILTGYFSDKTKSYWLFMILGYGLLISVPLMFFANSWQMVAVLMVFERLGKAIRNPSKDTIISSSTSKIGTGFSFGLIEFLDQLGGIVGPLIISAFFFFSNSSNLADYKNAYSIFLIPFIILMAVLFFAKKASKEIKVPKNELKKKEAPKVFWIYCFFIFFTTMGFMNFALISYYLKENNLMPDSQIPLFYSIAMSADAVIALVIGKFYDKLKKGLKDSKAGLKMLVIIPLASAFIPTLSFSSNISIIIIGIIFYGLVLGIHETIMKAAIADMTNIDKRGTYYGFFNAFYGIAFLVGSYVFGLLYEQSIALVLFFGFLMQAISLIFLYWLKKEANY